MGLEKEVSKGGGYVGGFLQLFDWNSKSRRKIFANKSDVPDGSKQGKKNDESLPVTRLRLIEDYETGVSSTKGGSGYNSSASSVADDDGSGTRAPSVVARLMGLDSLPTTSASEPYSTQLFESRSLCDSHFHRKENAFINEYQINRNSQSHKVGRFCQEIVEPRPPKLQNRPIERFQIEPLPPKSAKSVPITHHKLLSPIKSPGFISPKSAAHIMEAAAKILEPGLQAGPRGKILVTGSSSVDFKVRDLKESVSVCQRQLKLPEASKRPDESNAVKMLKGQSLNKSWNGSEETPIFRAPEQGDTNFLGGKGKGKSVSLAIQAKVNVQKREGVSSSNKDSLARLEEGQFRSKQTSKNQESTSKNKQSKGSTSAVLRQNDHKQNCATARDKLPLKPSVSTQQGKKVVSGDSSLARSKIVNKVPVKPKSACRKESIKISESEKELPMSRAKSLPRKKRAIDGVAHGEKCASLDSTLVNRENKNRQSHVSINEHRNHGDDLRREGMDVVSFTFTSPMVKSRSGSHSSGQMAAKQENMFHSAFQAEKSEANIQNKKFSSLGLNVIGGDALSILLEQKLRELTSGFESSCYSSGKTGNGSKSASILQDLVSALNSVSNVPGGLENKSLISHQDQSFIKGNSSCFATYAQLIQPSKLQGAGEITEYSSNLSHKESEYQHPSPVSILEASFSIESCNSSESFNSIRGCKHTSSTETQNSEHCSKKAALLEVETELSDSASSSFSGTTDRDKAPRINPESVHIVTEEQELEYVRVIISNTESMLKGFSPKDAREVVDPSLFEKMENDFDPEERFGRTALFDSVRECLNSRYSKYMKGGYKTWAQGAVILRSKQLPEEVYKEILGWRSMGDWMVDEVVDRDMSSGLGRWTLFDAEAFEIGVDIEKQIISSIIDEIVASLLL